MKAGHLLLLLIAFIAASHLRRDMIVNKKGIAFIQQNVEQTMANNTATEKNNALLRLPSGAGGMKKLNGQEAPNMIKAKQ